MESKLEYIFDFLKDLKRNNTREWIHQRANERRYDIVQRTMEQWVGFLLMDMDDVEDTHGLKAKQCLFRIWRDTRFSKDKTPCKTYVSAAICKGGRKNQDRGVYYIQLSPGGKSFVGGGVYMPDAERLRKIRKAIMRDGATLAGILKNKKFHTMLGGLEPLKLKTMPRDYKKVALSLVQRELLPYTSFIVGKELSDKEVLAKDFDTHLVKIFRTLKPLNDWLNNALEK
jgi:uncharacterized protein (TIGR02453 family)